VIITHYNPDGDAIGSSFGLKHCKNLWCKDNFFTPKSRNLIDDVWKLTFTKMIFRIILNKIRRLSILKITYKHSLRKVLSHRFKKNLIISKINLQKIKKNISLQPQKEE
jgi:c-di-AMP phosphodiesterase-like protein